jgi:hypothetical protein
MEQNQVLSPRRLAHPIEQHLSGNFWLNRRGTKNWQAAEESLVTKDGTSSENHEFLKCMNLIGKRN